MIHRKKGFFPVLFYGSVLFPFHQPTWQNLLSSDHWKHVKRLHLVYSLCCDVIWQFIDQQSKSSGSQRRGRNSFRLIVSSSEIFLRIVPWYLDIINSPHVVVLRRVAHSDDDDSTTWNSDQFRSFVSFVHLKPGFHFQFSVYWVSLLLLHLLFWFWSILIPSSPTLSIQLHRLSDFEVSWRSSFPFENWISLLFSSPPIPFII